jgi:thiol-disulfide isomerase/thioredoxin
MMKKFKLLTGAMLLCLGLSAGAANFKPGPWRFELKTEHAEIPFILHLQWQKNQVIGQLDNGKEKIALSGIRYHKNKLSIPLQTYEVSLELEHTSPTQFKGHYVRHNKDPKVMLPVSGVHGYDRRYSGESLRAKINLQGRWEVTLASELSEPTPGIVVFEQDGNRIHGSILTPTGDYRYFEGEVSEESFKAASFDGIYNYLFTGQLKNGQLEAKILSTSVTKVVGKLNPKAQLPNAFEQTKIAALNFEFPDLNSGRPVTLKDPRFRNKPVIVQIYGSWCPNCMDEMNYLIPWYQANAKRGIEIVALAFERSLDAKLARQQLLKVQKKKQVPYPILIAGSTADDRPADKLTGLQNFISFPTTIFLNRKHQVVKVHAGFSGPSTGEFYEKWKADFNATVDKLLKK